MLQKISVERSAGAVVFRRERGTPKYLALHYEAGHWDFPKGHIEKKEKTEETMRREVAEETGITELEFIKGFKKTIRYRYKWPPRTKRQVSRLKFVVFYLARTRAKKITLSGEHIGFMWLSYEKALDQLTYKTARDVLKAAHAFLTRS